MTNQELKRRIDENLKSQFRGSYKEVFDKDYEIATSIKNAKSEEDINRFGRWELHSFDKRHKGLANEMDLDKDILDHYDFIVSEAASEIFIDVL